MSRPSPAAGRCQDFGFEVDERWAKAAAEWGGAEASAVAVDDADRVYVFHRGPSPIVVFSPEGRILSTWGEGSFRRPHGLSIDGEFVFCTDDLDHTVRRLTLDGRLLQTLGESGKPSDTGATSVDYRTILRSGPPFHFPTNLAVAPSGDWYVADGYGNARIHQFAPDGRLLRSWGAPGAGPGQFHVPHGIAVDREGIVYVADRENSRIQLFSSTGEYLEEWTDVARPCQVCIDAVGEVYVAELGYRAGMWPGTQPPTPEATGGRLSIFSASGELKARWGGGDDPCAPGDFFAPHDACVDSKGDVYVAEVVWSAGACRGLTSPQCHTIQKFVRRREPSIEKPER